MTFQTDFYMSLFMHFTLNIILDNLYLVSTQIWKQEAEMRRNFVSIQIEGVNTSDNDAEMAAESVVGSQ